MATLERDARGTAHERLVRRFVRDVWNGEDLDAIETLASADLVVHHLGAGRDRSRESFAAFHSTLLDAIPDLSHEIDDLVIEGDRVTARLTLTGTPEHGIGALPATGGSFEQPGFQVYRLEGERVAELWVLPNAMGMLRDLGAFPDSPGKMLRLVGGAAKARLLRR